MRKNSVLRSTVGTNNVREGRKEMFYVIMHSAHFLKFLVI